MRDPYEDIRHLCRPEPIRPRQPLENRAKLFMPFDALRGFSLALLTKEKEMALAQPRTETYEEEPYAD